MPVLGQEFSSRYRSRSGSLNPAISRANGFGAIDVIIEVEGGQVKAGLTLPSFTPQAITWSSDSDDSHNDPFITPN